MFGFSEEQVRSMGRPAAGVKGIDLAEADEVVGLAVVVPDTTLLVAGERGIGKRTDFDEYRTQSRGGLGIKAMALGCGSAGNRMITSMPRRLAASTKPISSQSAKKRSNSA